MRDPSTVLSEGPARQLDSVPTLAYAPSLDGVRGLAVLAVVAYHSGLAFMPGGFLGVDVFFVLSGFLITTLLLRDCQSLGTIRLRRFWSRRARRLLPALLAVVTFVVCYAAFVAPKGLYTTTRGDALSALFYFANWHFIASGSNYFVQTGPVSPLTHTWSLAVEEQFYVVAPLLVLGLFKAFRRLGPLLLILIAGALGSALEMALLFRAGTNLSRLYYGTDTRAQSLLVGAALAVGLIVLTQWRNGYLPNAGEWGWSPTSKTSRVLIVMAGFAGLLIDAFFIWRIPYESAFLWQGGFLLAEVGAAGVLLAAVATPRALVAKALSVTPLRYVGRISYGVYLWHFPLFLWIDQAHTGISGYPLFGMRLAITLSVATVSFFGLEQPIRRGRFFRNWRAWVGCPIAVGGVLSLIVLTTGAGIPAPVIATSRVFLRTPTGASNRVLFVGDSTALALGVDLGFDTTSNHISVIDKGIVGCGVAESEEVSTQGRAGLGHTSPACNPASPKSAQWPALWNEWVAQYRPVDVVILAGRWELSNDIWQGQWTNITHRSFALYVRHQLERAVRIASSQGAHVDLLTAPCYSTTSALLPGPVVNDSPQRLAIYNTIVRKVAALTSARTTLINLDNLICSGGRYHEQLDGVTIRAPDGVHFPFFSVSDPCAADPDTLAETRRAGLWLGKELWPEILAQPSRGALRLGGDPKSPSPSAANKNGAL
ncbi:MAG: acyltransferase family protein [Acidimicrobiales bacterium]